MTLSVIIPIFNGAMFVEKLVDNINTINADMEGELEIILVNDGSTDNSGDICRKMASKYANVKLLDKENGGISSARNTGLKQVNGEFVTFCDQDDILIKGYAPFVKALKEHECDILIANYYSRNHDDNGQYKSVFINEDELCGKVKINYLVRLLSGGAYCYEGNNLNQHFTNFPPTVWNCIFKKEIIVKNHICFRRFVDYEDDWIFLIDNLLGAENVFLSKDSFYCWIVNPKSESHTHKYIPNLRVKLKPLMDYHCEVLRKAETPEDLIRFVRSSRKRNAILTVFFNDMERPYSEMKKDVNEAMIAYYEPGYAKLHKPTLHRRIENCFIGMFHNNFFFLAYLLNKYIVKFRFH